LWVLGGALTRHPGRRRRSLASSVKGDDVATAATTSIRNESEIHADSRLKHARQHGTRFFPPVTLHSIQTLVTTVPISRLLFHLPPTHTLVHLTSQPMQRTSEVHNVTIPGPTVKCKPALHYSVDLRIQTYTEPIPLRHGKLATKYLWIYGYFLQRTAVCSIPQRRHI